MSAVVLDNHDPYWRSASDGGLNTSKLNGRERGVGMELPYAVRTDGPPLYRGVRCDDTTSYNNTPEAQPQPNRHERRKAKALKREKKTIAQLIRNMGLRRA